MSRSNHDSTSSPNGGHVLVVGAGIVGLAFAWELARLGRRVTVLERSPAARGASIRNFGMVWPIGQPAGERHSLTMASRARWLELRDAGAIWARECGSVHAVREADEAAVLAEFAGGLTLAHYAGFEICPSLAAVKARFAAAMPEHVAAGIHVMASQNEAGEVILGDSHDYADVESPFGSERIDDLILDYARAILWLPDWRIAARWQGVYMKPAAGVHFSAEPQRGCHVMGSPGGAGMTLSFGIAQAWWREREAAAF